MTGRKERRNEFDLIRAVSTVWIVLFHYSYSFVQYAVGGRHIYLMMHANGTWGALYVSLFFMLSGASLYYNWQDRLTSFSGKGSVLEFYKKRWLAIFPLFYITWFLFYMMNVISFNWLWNWGGRYYKLILTFLGIDGYFMYKDMNYYTVGEWFLGAIIMLYILYPLLQWCMKKIPVISTVVIAGLFGLNTGRRLIPALAPYNAWVEISDNINLITCLFSFWIGMLLVSGGRRIINKASFAICFIAAVLIMAVPLPVSTLIVTPVLAVCYYVVLSFVSIWLDGKRGKWNLDIYDRITRFFSKYSFAIFLVHHNIIQKMMSLFIGKEFTYFFSIVYFLLILGIISIAAVVLSKLTDQLIKLVSGLIKPEPRADGTA